jgi:hypothetical protein
MHRHQYCSSLVGLTLVCLAQWLFASQPAQAYTLDKANRIITVSPTGDYTADARKAIEFLLKRPDPSVMWRLRFLPGKYYLKLPLYSVGLQNVEILSNPSEPAKFIKAAGFPQDYLFYTRMSRNITIRGFEFYGQTSFQDSKNPVWTDQGIYFGSCNNVKIDNNKFFNFGNAAIRVTTNEADPVKGVNSFNTVVTNNYFNNIYQISTTSNDNVHGATANYLMQNNTIVNLRGSVKFASRTDGAKDIKILNNVINGGDRYGLEIDNYDDFEIRDNTIENIRSVAINIYTAGDKDKIVRGFPWGDNFTIANNIIKSCGRGVRFSHEPFHDGFQYVPRNLVIANNTLNVVREPATQVPAIAVLNGKVDGVKLSQNKLYSIASKNYIGLVPGCTNVSSVGNLAEGNPLDKTSETAPASSSGSTSTSTSTSTSSSGSTSTTTRPAAPSNLSGRYDGSQSVRLSWTDNASNESNQEIWASHNGKDYSLIAKVYANTTGFTHRFRQVPTNPYFLYAVKAVNQAGPSSFSNTIRVNFTTTTSSAQ